MDEDKVEEMVEDIMDDFDRAIDPGKCDLEEAIDVSKGVIEEIEERIDNMKRDLERGAEG